MVGASDAHARELAFKTGFDLDSTRWKRDKRKTTFRLDTHYAEYRRKGWLVWSDLSAAKVKKT